MRTRVKESSRAAHAPVKGWRRHLEGWQAGLLAVTIAGTAALLVVPRAVAPVDIPAPDIRPAALDARLTQDTRLASTIEADARAGRLPYDVRELGDAIRAFGSAESADDAVALERAHRRIKGALPAALTAGDDLVLKLRAHQSVAFLRAMRAFTTTARPTNDLRDLAGSLPEALIAYGWYDPQTRRLAMTEAQLRALYIKRWNDITGARLPAFALTLDEERALYAFLIERPAITFARPAPGVAAEPAPVRDARHTILLDQKRLDKVRELAEIDPTYPADFARGVLLYRLGRYEDAAVAFDRHLTRDPDGPLALRAQNHLKAALEAR